MSTTEFTLLPDLALRTLGGAVIWRTTRRLPSVRPDPPRQGRVPAGDVRSQGAGVRRLGDASPPGGRP